MAPLDSRHHGQPPASSNATKKKCRKRRQDQSVAQLLPQETIAEAVKAAEVTKQEKLLPNQSCHLGPLEQPQKSEQGSANQPCQPEQPAKPKEPEPAQFEPTKKPMDVLFGDRAPWSGPLPHLVVACCISCKRLAVFQIPHREADSILNPQPIRPTDPLPFRRSLGFRASNRDTFILTRCARCEEYSASLFIRLHGCGSAPAHQLQHPMVVNTSMVSNWPVFRTVSTEFRLMMDEREPEKVVARRKDFWARGGLLGRDNVRFDFFDVQGEEGEAGIDHLNLFLRPGRSDEFFGFPGYS